MSDARIEIVAGVLREHGHNATGSGATTDDLATAIVNALDAGAGTNEAGTDAETASAPSDADAGTHANPETPTGTGTEGGAGNPSA